MRPLRLLLPALAALVLVSAAQADTDPTTADHCKTASADTAVSPARWRAHASRRTALYMIQHLREFCRLVSDLDKGTPDTLQPKRRALLPVLRARVLTPLYRAHPELEAAQPVGGPRQKVFVPTRRDISRKTASRFVDELQQLQRQLMDLQPAYDDGKDAQAAIAEAERFSNIVGELSFAETIAYTSHPDLFKKMTRHVPAQPRTAEHDATFRKLAPPRGSVRLSDAAYLYIRSFMRQLRQYLPNNDHVASISWSKNMKSKGPDDRDWIDEGAGWTFGAYSRSEVPPDVIDRVRGLDIVFSIEDPSVLKGKTFDIEGRKFVLRD